MPTPAPAMADPASQAPSRASDRAARPAGPATARGRPRASTLAPSSASTEVSGLAPGAYRASTLWARAFMPLGPVRSEEHTSELQSRQYLVCRLLLEKKKNTYT